MYRAILTLVISALAFAGDHSSKAVPSRLESVDSVARMTAIIDNSLQRKWKDEGVSPLAVIDDYAFLRRAYLDFAGRIPTVAEIDRFLEEPVEKRRVFACAELTGSDDFIERWTRKWEAWVPESAELRPSLARAAGGADELVKALLNPNAIFERGEKIQVDPNRYNMAPMTENVASHLLGIQLNCAQCHDHPFNPSLKQADYWSFNAFFHDHPDSSGSKLLPLPLKYDRHVEPGDEAVVATVFPRYPGTEEVQKREKEGRQDRPLYKTLADAVSKDPHFSEVFVNKVWGQYFGRGLNYPDSTSSLRRDLNGGISAGRFSDLLRNLAKAFDESGRSLHDLSQAICQSKAYQLESQKVPVDDGKFFFQVGIAKPLTQTQRSKIFLKLTGLQADSVLGGSENSASETGLVPGENSVNEATVYSRIKSPFYSLLAQHSAMVTLSQPNEKHTALEKVFLSHLTRLPNEKERAIAKESLQSTATASQRVSNYIDEMQAAIRTVSVDTPFEIESREKLEADILKHIGKGPFELRHNLISPEGTRAELRWDANYPEEVFGDNKPDWSQITWPLIQSSAFQYNY